ncbi:MAG: hypothetical protein HY852_01005 [Bradyrhizobium sp.]|uniref:hypothetical protein n=1 Tax=Bradyrhizobium sp. TaxID=376 RepID=UPI0025BF074E|nr:hypothetical protein [Bradyrhizobium sp.]MBI5260379.1 hypothetical protein [Bradyrhizobium sp.]
MFGCGRWLDTGLRVRALRALYRTFLLERTSQSRGRRLLREWLPAEQRAQFDAEGYFDVIGCDTGKRYRIRQGTSANVYEIDAAGRCGMGWCFVPAGGLVEGDVMLAQKIALETSELSALAVANSFPPLLRWGRPMARPF